MENYFCRSHTNLYGDKGYVFHCLMTPPSTSTVLGGGGGMDWLVTVLFSVIRFSRQDKGLIKVGWSGISSSDTKEKLKNVHHLKKTQDY
ncbi:hypothetical protein L873DRAFT_787965 [Choiromyces venosus 120613-1]|uniref:Uncharacterized protein n=1 Tax=Choiromyces venosus 120613-1 TaxID=1336337 RepID=A0A3N4KAE1_9PEZI|nr:hypothetical protein L873DRAFT_787965 [Choiromyces venosus 120613-1]